jgi:hypothetical protein
VSGAGKNLLIAAAGFTGRAALLGLLGLMRATPGSRTSVEAGPSDTGLDARGEAPERESMEVLLDWADQAQGDILHADSKAGVLFGYAGTWLALVSGVLVAVSTGDLVDVGALPVWGLVFGGAGLGCLAASVIALLMAIRPRLGSRQRRPDARSFIAMADMSTAELVRRAQHAVTDQALVAEQIGNRARIAHTKHRLIALACWLLLACLPLMAVPGVVAVLTTGGGA